MDFFVLLYLIIINVATFIFYAVDKWNAYHYGVRVPELTLLLLAIAGGSVGALLAIWLLRHKTRHAQFVWGVPGILLIQLALVWLISTA